MTTSRRLRINLVAIGFGFLSVLTCHFAVAQLEITEIMFDPGDDFGAWEWFEVHNTSDAAIDLDGFFVEDAGASAPVAAAPNISSIASGGRAMTTVIPAGGVAVLYDGFIGGSNPGTFNDDAFRRAWNLAGGVPVIAVDFFPALNNGGDTIALWNNKVDYDMDRANIDEDDFLEIVSFDHASLVLEYNGEFPSGNNMSSIFFRGNGSHADGANWTLSEKGQPGVTTSQVVTLEGEQTNSSDDLGNPGILPLGNPPPGLLITEVMYNPASADSDWEWIEVFNNTGATIDFAATPHVFDDNDGADLTAVNVTSGRIAPDEAAVLYDADALSAADIQEAWDPGGVLGTNFIPVTSFPALTNRGADDGDTIALWDDLADYQTEAVTGQGRTTDNAAVSLTYQNNVNGWPNDNGDSSIHLADLGLDPAVGANWVLSVSTDDVGSYSPNPVFGTFLIHEGGDIGSPGFFEVVQAFLDSDFDTDGDVDGDDFLAWQVGFGNFAQGGAIKRDGDADSDGDVDGDDFLRWQAQFGMGAGVVATSAVPEPTTLWMISLIGASMLARRRRACRGDGSRRHCLGKAA